MMKAGLLLLAAIGSIAAAPPQRTGRYVALGSSYAAGFRIGPVSPDAPAICARTANGYPQQVARALGLPLTDATCSGGTVEQIVATGQGGLPPQIEAVHDDATLVTITAGGNDVGYVGGMMQAAANPGKAAEPGDPRRFEVLRGRFRTMFAQLHQRAPNARIVVVTYPAVLPQEGTCAALGLTAADAARFRLVADDLAAVTRDTARQAGATVVDMATLSRGHDACSTVPWTNGAAPAVGASFHPNLAGATATAHAVEALLADPRRTRPA
jgi:lysophospholipase L1-like esterase